MNVLAPGFRIWVDTSDGLLALRGVTVPQARDLIALAVGLEETGISEQRPRRLRTGTALERFRLVRRCQIAGVRAPSWVLTPRGLRHARKLAVWIAKAPQDLRRTLIDVTARSAAEART